MTLLASISAISWRENQRTLRTSLASTRGTFSVTRTADDVVLDIADANQAKRGIDQPVILRSVAALLFHFTAAPFQRGFVCLNPPGG